MLEPNEKPTDFEFESDVVVGVEPKPNDEDGLSLLLEEEPNEKPVPVLLGVLPKEVVLPNGDEDGLSFDEVVLLPLPKEVNVVVEGASLASSFLLSLPISPTFSPANSNPPEGIVNVGISLGFSADDDEEVLLMVSLTFLPPKENPPVGRVNCGGPVFFSAVVVAGESAFVDDDGDEVGAAAGSAGLEKVKPPLLALFDDDEGWAAGLANVNPVVPEDEPVVPADPAV